MNHTLSPSLAWHLSTRSGLARHVPHSVSFFYLYRLILREEMSGGLGGIFRTLSSPCLKPLDPGLAKETRWDVTLTGFHSPSSLSHLPSCTPEKSKRRQFGGGQIWGKIQGRSVKLWWWSKVVLGADEGALDTRLSLHLLLDRPLIWAVILSGITPLNKVHFCAHSSVPSSTFHGLFRQCIQFDDRSSIILGYRKANTFSFGRKSMAKPLHVVVQMNLKTNYSGTFPSLTQPSRNNHRSFV